MDDDSPPHRHGSGRDAARWLFLAGAALGAVGLLDALAGRGPLAALLAGQPAMRPITSLCLGLAGLAGALRDAEGSRRWRRVPSVLAALVVLALGAATLAGHALALASHHELLAPLSAAGVPARPSPLAALGLTLLAAGVLLVDARPAARARPSEWLALAAWLAGFTALLGFAFDAADLHPTWHASALGDSPAAAVGLLLSSAGLLVARPSEGLMREATASRPGGALLRRLAPAAVLLPAMHGLVCQHLLRALGFDSPALVGAVVAAATTMAALALLVATAAPLNRAHEALEASRARARNVVELAPDGILLADRQGRCLHLNDAGCRMLGFTDEELAGRSIRELVPEDRVEQLARERERLLRGERVESEWVLRRKDGSPLPVEVNAKLLPDGRWQAFVRDVSERKRLEAALEDALAELVRAQSVAEVGSWRLDVRRDVLQWSAETYRLFGIPVGTPMNYEAFLACVHPDDRAYVDRAWTAALAGRPYDIEHRVVVGGEVRWVREKAELEFDEHGALVGGLGVTLHVTDRKQREEALRLSEAKAAGIVSASADAIISIDERQRITLFNEGAERIFGWTAAEALGAPLDLLIPERFREPHRAHVARFAAGATSSRGMGHRQAPILGLRKSGEEFPADAAISKIAVGGATILTAALRDVTTRQRAEDEQRFLSEVGSALSATLELPATLEAIGRLATRSFASFAAVYLVEGERQARRVKAVSRDPDRAWVCEALARVPIAGARWPELWSELEAGRTVLVEQASPERLSALAQGEEHLRAIRAMDPRSFVVAPLFAHGRLVGALLLVSCASDRAYDAHDARLAEQLAQRAANAIDNAQLYAAARRAIRSRDSVLGIVAHDLRNPLGAVLSYGALLRRAELAADPRCRKAGEAIERSGNRMNRIIEDLLDVTRLEEGRLSLEPGRVAVRPVVADAIAAEEPLATAAALKLVAEVADDVPDVWADRDRLLQVFENLVGNALKHTPPGGTIRVGAAPAEGEVSFWVTDTGAGICAEALPHLFDRFWQADDREKRNGLGLGLSIVKGLVEAHGGRIRVESERGRGTTFFFTLPAAPPATVAEADARAP